MAQEKEVRIGIDQVKYLGFDKGDYDAGFLYHLGEEPDDRLNSLLSNPENVKAREQMLNKVVDLDEALSHPQSEKSFDKQLLSSVKMVASKSADPSTLRFIESLEKPGMLFAHLKETGDSVVAFFENVKQDQLLSPRQVGLMEFVARTHDVCKLLGSLNAQIDPDHEIIYKKIVGKHLEGQVFYPTGGEPITFSKEEGDIEFITSVAGAHEDIWREESFATLADSLKKNNGLGDAERASARARSILHFIDIFGNAVRFDRGELKIVNEDAFEARFIDLFKRHIKLPIGDWAKGKVFRPQWGLYGVAGLTSTFRILKDEWGINVDPNLTISVQDGITGVLKAAENTIIELQGESSSEELSRKLKSIQDVLAELN